MSRGGIRQGAGRPKGQGKYGEKTKPIRVPISLITEIERFVQYKGYQLPLYGSKVSAGFPSPADDHIERTLDLNIHLIRHPSATFFVRASGQSMIGAGIHNNDILVVDRSVEPIHGKIVIAAIQGELTVKRLIKKNNILYLMPENDNYPPIEVKPEQEIFIWGVVTYVIHAL